MTTRIKKYFCPITKKQVRLSGEEFIAKGGIGNITIYHPAPKFVCDEAALNRCKEKNCPYPSNNKL